MMSLERSVQLRMLCCSGAKEGLKIILTVKSTTSLRAGGMEWDSMLLYIIIGEKRDLREWMLIRGNTLMHYYRG